MRLVKLFICSLILAVSFPTLAEEEKLLPDTECVNHCQTLGYAREECYQQCPKFVYRGKYLRDTKRYYIYRDCVQQCIMSNEHYHYYLCATQRCRVRE